MSFVVEPRAVVLNSGIPDKLACTVRPFHRRIAGARRAARFSWIEFAVPEEVHQRSDTLAQYSGCTGSRGIVATFIGG